MHFQNSTVLTGRAFSYIFCDTSLHVKHCIAFAVWRVGVDQIEILHKINMGTEACFCLNIFLNSKTEVISITSFGRLFHALMVDGKKKSENKLEFDLKL